MKLPRDMNGEHLAVRLAGLGFARLRQSGSHIVLKHEASGETVSIPAHRPLKTGTLRSILSEREGKRGAEAPRGAPKRPGLRRVLPHRNVWHSRLSRFIQHKQDFRLLPVAGVIDRLLIKLEVFTHLVHQHQG